MSDICPSDRLKDLARKATILYKPLWKINNYGISDNPKRKDFEITEMISQLTIDGEYFLIQYKNFDIDRLDIMEDIDEKLNLDCLFGSMNNLFSMYEKEFGHDIQPITKVDVSECKEQSWYATDNVLYFDSFEEAELEIAKKIGEYCKEPNNKNNKNYICDLAPFDIRTRFPDLLF